jgi:hypothetical protein
MTLRTLGLLTLGFCAGAASHIALARAQSVAAILDAPLAVRDMYTVDLENEFVRVVRFRYPAHASGAMSSDIRRPARSLSRSPIRTRA